MNVVGIIAEFNPFHRGHEYLIKEARQRTGADFVVVIMSGYFTERGIPACFDKLLRAECATLCGADLVLELPTCYATGSAEIFARGAVSILDRLGLVNTLAFGTEGDVSSELLLSSASALQQETPRFKQRLKEGLSSGLTFPAARMAALEDTLKSPELALLTTPNSLLGLEYTRAALTFESNLHPVPIPRVGQGYHDGDLTSTETNEYRSATALRLLLSQLPNEHVTDTVGQDESCAHNAIHEHFLHELPSAVASLLADNRLFPIFAEDFQLLYSYALQSEGLSDIHDVSSALATRFLRPHAPESYEDFVNRIKTKQVTRARVERALVHTLLHITEHTLQSFLANRTGYARILSVSQSAAPLLRELKRTSALPVITKLANAKRVLTTDESRLLSFDLLAGELYRRVAYQKYKVILPDEFTYNVARNLT